MGIQYLSRDHPDFPVYIKQYLGDRTPHLLAAWGNLAILLRPAIALFCSAHCPGSLILPLYDRVCAWRDQHQTIISGFHSPLERECLRLLLRGSQPIIICPARSLQGMRLPREWRQPLAAGRLLLLSPFTEKHRRITADLAWRRNELVAALAQTIFIPYAAPGSKTARFCEQIAAWGKPLEMLPEQIPLVT